METTSFDRYLEPPPRLVPSAEALPHLGGLALPRYTGELPEEIEAFTVDALDDAFDQRSAAALLERALCHPEVQARLARGRILPIGVSRRGERAKDERLSYLVVAYDYSANVAVEITLDEQAGLLSISDQHYQPPPIEQEIARAIELARADGRIAARVAQLTGSAIPFSGHDNEYAGQRVLEVLFGCRSERLPRWRAWVDLGSETVLHAGGECPCCGHDERNERDERDEHDERNQPRGDAA